MYFHAKLLTPATDSRQAAAMIEQQGDRLLELVNQLLDITKLQTAAMTPAPKICQNIVGHIEMIIESFSKLAQQKGVTLSYEPAETLLMMDYVPDYLHKIVANLLSNALKFTGSGGAVRVSTARQADCFCLDVSDTGCGIAKDRLPHIFEPFYQVAESGQASNGTGLGLSLVHQLVETIGGSVSVESSPGHGTSFRLCFPYTCLNADSASQLVIRSGDISQRAYDTGLTELHDADSADDTGVRLLVVEDNLAVAYYIGSILSSHYDVFYAIDGKEGLEKACRIVPDAVLIDLMMPGMNGVELCRRPRDNELTSHVPVVMITAKTDESARLEGLEAGADAFLTKPFSAPELTIRVEKLLEQRRLLREKFSKLMDQFVLSETQTEKRPVEETGLPSQLDAKFLEKVDALIIELMPRGEADLDHLTSQLCMHSSTFRRKIQALTGNPPAQYIMRRRLEHACRLLADYPNVTVAEVAFRCGFADAAHFNHAFRRIYSTTPLKYVKELKPDV